MDSVIILFPSHEQLTAMHQSIYQKVYADEVGQGYEKAFERGMKAADEGIKKYKESILGSWTGGIHNPT